MIEAISAALRSRGARPENERGTVTPAIPRRTDVEMLTCSGPCTTGYAKRLVARSAGELTSTSRCVNGVPAPWATRAACTTGLPANGPRRASARDLAAFSTRAIAGSNGPVPQ